MHHFFSWLIIFDTFLNLLNFGPLRFLSHFYRQLKLCVSIFSIIDFAIDIKYNWFDLYLISNYRLLLFIPIRLFFILRDIRIILLI